MKFTAKVFAMNGDVTGMLIVMVQFLEEPFQLTPFVWVPTVGAIDEYLNTHPEEHLLPLDDPHMKRHLNFAPSI